MKDIKKEITVEIVSVAILLVTIAFIYVMPLYYNTSKIGLLSFIKQIILNIFFATKNLESIFVGVLSSLIVTLILTVNHFLSKKKNFLNSIINSTKKLIYIYHNIPVNNVLDLSNDLKIEYYFRFKNHSKTKRCMQKIMKLMNSNKALANKCGYSKNLSQSDLSSNIIIEYDFCCKKIKEYINENIKLIEKISDELECSANNISNIFNYNRNKKKIILRELTNNITSNSLFNEIVYINNYKDVANRILELNNRMIIKLKKLIDNLDLEFF